jgi:hypothetical protein
VAVSVPPDDSQACPASVPTASSPQISQTM